MKGAAGRPAASGSSHRSRRTRTCRLREAALGVAALEQEALDLVGRIRGDAVLLEQVLRELPSGGSACRPDTVAVARVHLAEHQDLARAEDVGRQPVERRPVDRETQVDSACCEKPRIDEPSNVRLSSLFSRNFLS
jgi:hypothetical protein